MNVSNIKVSDHAFLRYLERVKGFPEDYILSSMLSNRSAMFNFFNFKQRKAIEEKRNYSFIKEYVLIEYAKRYLHINLEELKREMLADKKVVCNILFCKSGKVQVSKNLYYMVKEYNIITVVHSTSQSAIFVN